MDNEVNERLNTLASSNDIHRAVIFNSTARIEVDSETKLDTVTGNATEKGLIEYLTKSSVPVKALYAERDDRNKTKLIFDIPFSSKRKRATIAYKIDNDSKVRVYCKGAPDIVIEFCEKYIGEGGAAMDLGRAGKDHALNTIVKNYATKCLRTLLISYVDYTIA